MRTDYVSNKERIKEKMNSDDKVLIVAVAIAVVCMVSVLLFDLYANYKAKAELNSSQYAIRI